MSEVTSDQFRAARAMLGWSLLELATAAKVSVSSVVSAEGRIPERGAKGSTVAVRETLETAGICFIGDEGDGAGVKLRARSSVGDSDGVAAHAP